MASNSLHSVSLSPLSTRPSYVPGEENDPDDEFDVLCVGDPFKGNVAVYKVLNLEMLLLGECNALWGEREQSRFMFVCTLLYTLLNNPPAHICAAKVLFS